MEGSTVTDEVISVLREGKKVYIELDKDILRPAMGGQDSDRGHIIKNGSRLKVIDVIKRNNKTYVVLSNLNVDIHEGDKVEVELDLDRRNKLSMLHTAQHIFFQALVKIIKDVEFSNVFLTIKNGNPHGILEIESKKEITVEELNEVENLVNNVIFEGRKVVVYEVKRDELTPNIRVRDSTIAKHNVLRVVEVEGFDWSACSGTHVENTKQIVFFKVQTWKQKKIANGFAYKFVFTVGSEALRWVLDISNKVISSSVKLGFQPENIQKVIKNCHKDARNLAELSKVSIPYFAKEVIERLRNGERRILLDLPGLKQKYHLELIKLVTKAVKEHQALILISTKINNEIIFTFYGTDEDVKQLVNELKKHNIRFGGKEIYQGKISEDAFNKILARLVKD
ncbi:MAG: hypothetical protein ACP6IP_00480 [Candidatus Njordarchaeia archaeon]